MGRDLKLSLTDYDPFLTEDGTPDLDAMARRGTGPLRAAARRLVRSDADAEDVLQDAFLSAVRARDRFEGRALTTSWMYRITYNAGLMQLRTRRRKGAESLDALPPEVAERGLRDLQTDDDAAPDRALLREQLVRALDEVVEGLPEVDRAIVRARLGEGRSTEEVAAATGLSTTATKSRLHRARRALQAALTERGLTPALLGV